MNDEPEVESKFVPKENNKCGKKCFDIVDKWCTKILTKTETGDNWNKIIEREICLTKIKYPFLGEKQIRGKALQKFGIPNSMGDIVRSGVNRVKGNLARELNHLNIKKESRIPPPFKMNKRKENVAKVKREIKQNSSSTEKVNKKIDKNSESDENSVDTNFNLTPRKKKLTNPRKCLLKRFRIPDESDNDDADEHPKKRIKIEEIDLREIQENAKYYMSPSETMNESTLDNSANENGDDENNNSEGEENLQVKRMIYSQFSENGKKYLTSFSDWKLTQDYDESQIICDDKIPNQDLQNNAECILGECDYSSAAASPIFTGKFTNPLTFHNYQRRDNNADKLSLKNPIHSGNDKLKNAFFQLPKKSMNNLTNGDVLMKRILMEIQKSSDTNVKSITNEYFNVLSSDKIGIINSKQLSHCNESLFNENNYFDKENECPQKFFNENRNYNPFFNVLRDKNRRILSKTNFQLIQNENDNVSNNESDESTLVISQNNDKSSSSSQGTQPLTATQFSIPENSSGKVLKEIKQSIEQNLESHEILNDEDLTQINTQSAISLSPLPTDNSQDNPWLNLTSQDFSQLDHNYSQREFTQDSGKATQDTIASDFSFMSVSTSNSPEISTGTLQDLCHAKMATIKKNIEIILLELQRQDSQGE